VEWHGVMLAPRPGFVRRMGEIDAFRRSGGGGKAEEKKSNQIRKNFTSQSKGALKMGGSQFWCKAWLHRYRGAAFRWNKEKKGDVSDESIAPDQANRKATGGAGRSGNATGRASWAEVKTMPRREGTDRRARPFQGDRVRRGVTSR